MSKGPKARPFNMKTVHGKVVADILNLEQSRQVNVYMADGHKAAMFALFPSYCTDEQIRAALLDVLNGEALLPDVEVTELVKGCEVAGTLDPAQFDIQYVPGEEAALA